MHRPLPHARHVLAENRRTYESLVQLVEHYAAGGDQERVLRTAALAAGYACHAPTGLLADPRLERAMAQTFGAGEGSVVDGGRDGDRVLHVLTQVYSTGGHTRAACRWIGRDYRRSDVVLTDQHGPVPGWLVTAVEESGGTVVDLRASTPGVLDRVRELRARMDLADVVVLHTHQHDSLAVAAALLPGPRPPVVYENHGDLLFWLGTSVTDVLCDFRPEVRRLALDMRSVPAERIHVLPLPVDAAPVTEPSDLRQRLGLPDDAVVALTVTSDWKVAAQGKRGMALLLDNVLHWSPRVVCVLVGVSATPEWARLSKKYPGRVQVMGLVDDPAPYYAGADVFIDSYPTRAGTTPIEAAMAGLPVLAVVDSETDDPVSFLQCSPVGLEGFPVSDAPGKLAVAVHRLVSDPAGRLRAGERAREAATAVHDGPGWRAALESLYARARSATAAQQADQDGPVVDEEYGAALLSAYAPATVSSDPRQVAHIIGDLYDLAARHDVFALANRRRRRSLSIRMSPGWHLDQAGASRLLALAGRHRSLAVSLPFLPDDPSGEATSQLLARLLGDLGQDFDSCGDISVEVNRPALRPPVVEDELPMTVGCLDWLTGLVSSPGWSLPDPSDTHWTESVAS